MECPDRELLKAHQRGETTGTEGAELEAHLGVCEACRDVYARLESTQVEVADRPIGLIIDSSQSPEYDLYMKLYRLGYVIEREFGHGGFGVVYEARQRFPNRVVALKVIKPERLASAGVRSRFRREANALATLQHANIVQIFEVGKDDDPAYLAMEFVGGGSLAKRLENRLLQSADAARLVKTLADAMHYAHEKGVIHRDLKPANILLTVGGSPKVADFGLAKLLGGDQQTITQGVLGTPAFMAPEQAVCRPNIGAATDVYGLGAILYHSLTGQPPFGGATVDETLWKVVNEDPTPPSQVNPTVPGDLETICLKCLYKEPGSRYTSAKELADDLDLYLRQEPIDARPREYREHWKFAHEKDYAGEVWIQLIPKPENRNTVHEYTIRWGAWKYRDRWNFRGDRSVTLLHKKDSPLSSVPVYVNVSPPCHVRVGHEDRPHGKSHNINAGWTLSFVTLGSWLGVFWWIVDLFNFLAWSVLHGLGLARHRRNDQRGK